MVSIDSGIRGDYSRWRDERSSIPVAIVNDAHCFIPFWIKKYGIHHFRGHDASDTESLVFAIESRVRDSRIEQL